jgi:hypothetical protein
MLWLFVPENSLTYETFTRTMEMCYE